MNIDNSLPKLLLVGNQAKGKTTLFNNLTGLAEPTQDFGDAVTKDVCIAQEKQKKFVVIDTAGIFSSQGLMINIATLFAAFKLGIISGIMIFAKMDRDALILKEIEEIVPLFKRYHNLIIIAITHWDLTKKNDLKTRNELEKTIKKKILDKFDLDLVLFTTNQGADQEEIRAQIHSVLVINLKKQYSSNIMFNENEIGCFFQTTFKNSKFLQIQEMGTEVGRLFRIKALAIKNCINNLNVKDPEHDNKVSFIIQYTQKLACEEIESFEKRKTTDEVIMELLQTQEDYFNYYLIHIFFLKVVEMDVADVVKVGGEKINSQYLKHFKRCPKCKQQIWFKDKGCKGSTFCGSIDNSKKNIQKQITEVRYQPEWNEDFSVFSIKQFSQTVNLQPTIQHKPDQNVEEKYISFLWFPFSFWGEKHTVSKNTGCGNQFDWDSADPISLKELQNMIGDNQLITFIQQEDQSQDDPYKKSKKEFLDQFNSQVDTQFKNIKRL